MRRYPAVFEKYPWSVSKAWSILAAALFCACSGGTPEDVAAVLSTGSANGALGAAGGPPEERPEAVDAGGEAAKKIEAASPIAALIPLGEIPDREIALVRGSLETTYGFEVRVLERRAAPKTAYYDPRRRYRAEKLLDWLRSQKPEDAAMVMGLIADDISTTKDRHRDWGICGLADLGGPASVVSTHRIKHKLGKGLDATERERRYERRLAELAAHEFGHQLGLPHCPNEGCVMEDAKGTVTTFNRSTGELCGDCRRLLAKAGWGRTRPER